MDYNSIFIVDTSIVKKNLNNIYELTQPNVQVIPILKGNAYGHGLVPIAQILESDHRISFMGVAQTIEALELRNNGIKKRIILLCGILPSQLEHVISNNIEPAIHNIDALKLFDQALKERNLKEYPIHLKINTGLNRLGFKPGIELEEACKYILSTDTMMIASTYSHFGDGITPNSELCYKQREMFDIALQQMDDLNINPGIRHICDSGATEWYKDAHYDAVRIGRGLYMDSPWLPLGERFKDAGSWHASIISVRTLEVGESFGYSHVPVEKQLQIAIMNIGYADGLQSYGLDEIPVLLNGKTAKIKSIAMDQTYLDVTGMDVKMGDEVTIFGEAKDGSYQSSHAISHLFHDEGCTLTTHMSPRVKRIYK